MKRILLNLVLIFLILAADAQIETRFITTGKIEFERKTNLHRLFFSGETNSWQEAFKKAVPQFRTDYFDLYFNESKTLYKPGKDSDVPKPMGMWQNPPAMENTVYKDLLNGSVTSQKQIFEQLFLLSDSLEPIQWKIQSETRIIAGFECRKALARICDSVVVVAFYTEEIIPSGGPESFHGLPGMILGLAVPRLYTTWFATKLQLIGKSEESKITPPSKGKKATQKEMLGTIDAATKDYWDKSRDRSLWLSSL